MPTEEQIISHTTFLENLPGQDFDEDKKTTIFAEDLKTMNARIGNMEYNKLPVSGENQGDIYVDYIGGKTTPDVTLDINMTILGHSYTAGQSVYGDITMQDGTNIVLDAAPSSDMQAANKKYIDDLVAAALNTKIYPVGCLYFSVSVSTNPGTILGFGTWTAYAEGRAIVGKAASGTFGTVNTTMGAETHTLTSGQMPDHGFGFGHHGDEGGSVLRAVGAHGHRSVTVGSPGAYRPPTGALGGAGSNQQPYWNFGNNEAHNNIQPSIVVYIWRRTA